MFFELIKLRKIFFKLNIVSDTTISITTLIKMTVSITIRKCDTQNDDDQHSVLAPCATMLSVSVMYADCPNKSIMLFVIMLNSLVPGATLRGRLLAIPLNIRLGWKDLPVTNTLAYWKYFQISAVKSFITLIPGANAMKLITAVSYAFS